MGAHEMISAIPAFPLKMELSSESQMPCDVCIGPPDRAVIGAGTAITCIVQLRLGLPTERSRW